jgi:hypothetical protein
MVGFSNSMPSAVAHDPEEQVGVVDDAQVAPARSRAGSDHRHEARRVVRGGEGDVRTLGRFSKLCDRSWASWYLAPPETAFR